MARKNLEGKIQTVNGLISPEELGMTLPHEHCIVDISIWFQEPVNNSDKLMAHQPVSLENLGWVRYNPISNVDNLRLLDEEMAISEILRYKQAGGKSIVDQTDLPP